VKEGQAIYRLADLSTVWLMLALFPEDAATIRHGQQVEAEVQSLPGRKFTGHVAFIDPNVDPKTRTVGVRVVIANGDGLLRVGDYGKATIEVPLTGAVGGQGETYDTALAVPRNAVLMAGSNSVIYVETEPGRFEIRQVVLGPTSGDQIVILEGVAAGEQVATRGNFLIDSQMQLAGNPSLIDPTKTVPTKAEPKINETVSAEMIAALSELSTKDRGLVNHQRICPVTMMQLGSMGTPKRVDVNGTPVFICCDGCRESLLDDPETYLAILETADSRNDTPANAPPMDLPPMGIPEIIEPQGHLPPIAVPQSIIQRVTEIDSVEQRGEVVR
jgi:Cu(I)/Ag(I) efflux system membrane fusion protein